MRCQALYLAAWCTITSVAAGLDWHSLSQVDPAQDVVPRVVTLSKAPTEPADAGSGFTSFDLWSGLETDASLQTVVSAFADDLTCSYDPVTGFVLGLGLGGRTACTLGAARVTIPLSAGGYVSGLSIAPAATPPQIGKLVFDVRTDPASNATSYVCGFGGNSTRPIFSPTGYAVSSITVGCTPLSSSVVALSSDMQVAIFPAPMSLTNATQDWPVTSLYPALLPASNAATTSVTLVWSDIAPGDTEEVYAVKCVQPGAGCNGARQGTGQTGIERGTQGGTVTGLTPGVAYACYVVATYPFQPQLGPFCSDALNVTLYRAPDMATSLTTNQLNTSTVTVSWVDGAAAKPDETYALKCVLGDSCSAPGQGSAATNITRGTQLASVTALTPGTAYKCYVVATNAAGSTCSAPLPVTTWSVPAAPFNLTALTTNTTSVTLGWNDGVLAVPGQVYGAKCVLPGGGCDDAAQGTQALTLARGTLSATISGLVPGTSYDCYVRASNVAGATCSASLPVQTYIEPPPPTNVAYSALTSTNATISWTDGPAATPAQTYQVRCVAPGAACTALPLSTSVAAIPRGLGIKGYVVANLTAGMPYWCYVVASNIVSNTCSSPVAFTTYTIPTAPTNVTSPIQSVSSISLTWADGLEASPSQVFEVRCTLGNGTCASPVAGNSATGILRNTNTGIVSGLTSGQTYTCFVLASNAAGTTCSASVTATTYNLPPPVTGVNTTAVSTTSIGLIWVNGAAALPLQVQDVRCGLAGVSCAGPFVGTGASNINRPGMRGSVTGLTAGTRYDCFVLSRNAAGTSCSNALTVNTYVGPNAPTAVAPSTVSATSVALTWSDGVAAVPQQTLTVECTLPGATCAGTAAGVTQTVPYGTQTASVTGLAQGTAYECYVYATNVITASACSSAVNVTTYTVPAAPTGVNTTALTVSSASIVWADGAPASPLQLYEVKCVGAGLPCNSTSQGTGQVRISRGTQSALVTGLASGSPYTCFVVASNAAGSACSAGLDITTYALPVAPSSLNVTLITTSSVRVSWYDGAASIPPQLYDLKCVLPGAGCGGTAVGITIDGPSPTPASVAAASRTLLANKASPSVASVVGAPELLLAKSSSPASHWFAHSPAASPFTTLAQRVSPLAMSPAARLRAPRAVMRDITTSSVTGLAAGSTYDCYVRASNAAGLTCSQPLTVTTYIAPDPVIGVNTTTTTTAVTATWNDGALAVPPQRYDLVCGLPGTACNTTAPNLLAGVERGVASAGVTGLLPSTAYVCYVRSFNAAGVKCSAGATVQTQPLPLAPGVLSPFVLTADVVTLVWDDDNAAPPAQTYNVLCTLPGRGCNASAAVGTGQAEIAGGVQLGAVSGLTGSTLYACYVQGLNAGSTVCSAPLNVTTAPSPPAATNVTVANVSTSGAWFVWAVSALAADPVEKYRVKCVLPGEGCDGVARGTGQVNIARSARAGTISGLSPNNAYDCFIRSTNLNGASCSTAVPITTYSVPAAPANVTAVNVTGTLVSLAWGDNLLASPAQTYAAKCVVAGLNCSAPSVGLPVAAVARTVGTATVANLTQGSNYTCFVAASNAAGTTCSAPLAVTTASVPAAAVNVTAVATGTGAVAVTWSDNRGAVWPAPTYAAKCVPTLANTTTNGTSVLWNATTLVNAGNATCGGTAAGFGGTSVPAGTQSASVLGLLPGSSYACYVVATTPAGSVCSAPSLVVTYSPPVAPFTIIPASVQDTQAIFTWLDGQLSTPVEAYKLKCVAPNATCNGTAQGTVEARIARGTQVGIVTGLTPGAPYDCYVRVSNKAGASCSSPVSVVMTTTNTTWVPPAPASILSAVSAGPSVNLTWASSNATAAGAVPPFAVSTVKCVAAGAGCSAVPLGASPIVSGNVFSATVTSLTLDAAVDCYVVVSSAVGPVCSAPVPVVVGATGSGAQNAYTRARLSFQAQLRQGLAFSTTSSTNSSASAATNNLVCYVDPSSGTVLNIAQGSIDACTAGGNPVTIPTAGKFVTRVEMAIDRQVPLVGRLNVYVADSVGGPSTVYSCGSAGGDAVSLFPSGYMASKLTVGCQPLSSQALGRRRRLTQTTKFAVNPELVNPVVIAASAIPSGSNLSLALDPTGVVQVSSFAVSPASLTSESLASISTAASYPSPPLLSPFGSNSTNSTNGTTPAPTTATSLRVVNGAPGWLVLAQFTTFVLANSNPSPVVLTNITVDINTSFNGGRSAVLPFELLSSTTSLQGNPTPGLTGFSVVATGSATVPYNTGSNPVSPFAGLSVSIPAQTALRFAVRIPVNPDFVGMIDGYDVNRTAVANGVSLLVGSASLPNGTDAVGWTYQYGPNSWSGFTSAFYGTVGLLTPAAVVAPSPFAL